MHCSIVILFYIGEGLARVIKGGGIAESVQIRVSIAASYQSNKYVGEDFKK